jgi:hypothetical protein
VVRAGATEVAVDTVTLELSGDVSLDDFSDAMRHLRGLLAALTREVAGNAEIVWTVDALEAGSALTAVRGRPVDVRRMEDVEDVVRAYGAVGVAIQEGDRLSYSEAVKREADGLTSLINGRVSAIRFETPETEALVNAPTTEDRPSRVSQPDKFSAYGAVEGRVQTLSNRGGLRFTLFDVLNDRAVSCYFAESFDVDVMRGVWGRRAIVEGMVTRDGRTGRALTIRRVTDVVLRPEGERDDYTQARGAMRGAWADLTPEQVVRQMRDA